MADPWEEAAKDFKSSPHAAQTVSGGGDEDWKVWQQTDTPPGAGNTSGFSQFTKGLSEGNPLSMREWPAPGTKIPSIGETLNPMPLIRGAIDVGGRLLHGDPEAIGQFVGMTAHPLGPRGAPMEPAMVPNEGIINLKAAMPSGPSMASRAGHFAGHMIANKLAPGIGGPAYEFARTLFSGENAPKFSEFSEDLRPMQPFVEPRQGPQAFPVSEQPLPAKAPFEPIRPAALPGRPEPPPRIAPLWEGTVPPKVAPTAEPVTAIQPPPRTPGLNRAIRLTEESRTPAWQSVQAEPEAAPAPAPIVPAAKSITGRAPGGLGSAAQAAAESKPTPLIGAATGEPTPTGSINIAGPEGLPQEYLESAKEGAVAQAQNRFNRVKGIIDAARQQGKDLGKMGPDQRGAYARTVGSGRPLSPSTDKLLLQEWAKSKPGRMAGGEPIR